MPKAHRRLASAACLREHRKNTIAETATTRSPGKFAGNFQNAPLQIIDQIRFIQKIIECGINNTLRKAKQKGRRQKQTEIPR